MYKVEDRSERRAVSRRAGQFLAGLSRKILMPALMGLAAFSLRAQAVAPQNDNFTNAIALVGSSGTVRGSTVGATGENSEFPHNGSEATNSIWYVWTAPDYGWYTFNTRGSTDSTGNDLNTVLGVYTGTSVDSLQPVFATSNTGDPNDDDPSGGVTSRVTFQTTPGTTYFIAVDSAQDAPPGNVVLSWFTAPSAGTFAFASGVVRGQQMYATGTGVTFPGVGTAMDPSQDAPNNSGSRSVAGGWPQQMSYVAGDGDFFKRLTITRYGQARGRATVDVTIDSTVYTNYYQTNITGTNILTFTVPDSAAPSITPTNFYDNPNIISFTNILITNVFVTNRIQDNLYGNLFFNTNLDAYVVNLGVTNTGNNVTNQTLKPVTDLTCTGIPLYTCVGNRIQGNSTSTNGFTTFVVTNIFCTNFTVTNYIDSVTGGPPGDFATQLALFSIPQTLTVPFDDQQMSYDMPGAANPWHSDLANTQFPFQFGEVPPGGLGDTNMANYVLFGRFGFSVTNTTAFNLSLFSGTGLVDNYPGVSRTYVLTLSNPQLDPQESQDIAPPTVDPTYGAAGLNVVTMDAATPRPQIECKPTEQVFNFGDSELYFARQNPQGDGNQNVFLQITVNRGGNVNSSGSVGVRVNWTEKCGVGSFHRFPLSPGSDYGYPGGTNSDIDTTTFSLDLGTWDFGANVIGVTRSVGILPIANSRVSFNKDIRIQLYNPSGSVPAYLGNMNEANVTILFNDEPSRQQPAGAVDRTHNRDLATNSYPPFNPVPGANSTVYSVAVQKDGKSVIGGDFTAFDTIPMNRIARMDTNGLPDSNFQPGDGANDFISSVAVDANNNILIAGGFTSFNGNNRYHIARLTSNGALDGRFNPGFGANGTIWAMAQQSDGKIIVGGEFTSFNATNSFHIARLNTDGTLDSTFNPSLGANDDVFAVAVSTNGQVLIGGQFTSVNGIACGHIARLNSDGSLDTTFNPGAGTDDTVYSIAIQPDNQILVGGSFGLVNQVSHSGLARLNTDGSLDTSFDTGSGCDGAVYAIAVLPSGNALIGGSFTTYNGTPRGAVARLQVDGSLDTTFMDTAYNQFAGLPNHYYSGFATNGPDVDPYYQFNTRNFVFAIAPENYGNTNIMIGGGFARVGGGFRRDDVRNRLNVARLVGGATPGPGNISLVRNTYTVNENAANLFVDVVRTNGSLGPVGFFFTTNTFAPGPGVASGSDFGIAPNFVGQAFGGGRFGLYDSYYDQQEGQSPCTSINCPGPNFFGWQQSDAYTGSSQDPLPECPPSTTPQLFLSIKDNSTVDGNRLAGLQLTGVDGNDLFQLGGQYIPLGVALGRSSAKLQIVDNDYYAGTFGFSQSLYTVNRNGGTVTITVLRTNASSGTVVLNFTTANNTALQGIDYVKTNGSLTFGPGVTSRTFSVRILNSFTAQPDKSFNVQLSFASNPGSYGQLDPNVLSTNSVVTIIDNNYAPGHVNFSSPTYTVDETSGSAKISVTRTGGSVGAISVQFAATALTATNNVNFVATNGTLTWNNNDTSTKTFQVPVIHDGAVAGPLTVNLALSNPILISDPTNPSNTNILGVVTNAVLTVADEDAAGQIGFIVPNFNVMEDAPSVHITVSRTGGVAGSASIGFATTNLGPTNFAMFAQAATNYSPTSGILNFGPGELTKSFDVALINNGVQNPNKVFGLVLFNPNPSAVTNSSTTFATVTIIDDETQHTPAGQVDTTYTSPGFNDFVLATSLQPDGKLVAGGNFTLVNSMTRNRIARLNTDGTVDTSFGDGYSGADGSVQAVLAQSPNPDQIHTNSFVNGPIVIAGSFNLVNNVFRHKIARLNTDGGLDTTFNPGSGADGVIYALAQTYSGANTNRKVIAVGQFASFNGVPANGIVQLNDDGTVDTTFNTGAGNANGIDGTIYSVAVQADGKILIGGDFTIFNGAAHGHIARLNPDGSVDNTFNPDTGSNGSVRAIAVQPDGNIVIGGLFASVNGTAFNHVARLKADGTVDPTFNVGAGANDSVLALAVDSQARIYVAGEFTSASGVTRFRLTRLMADGTVDPGINFGAGADNFIATVALQSDDQIIVGGGFTSFDNIPQGHIARLAGGSIRGDGQVTFDRAEYVVNENGTNAVITLRRIGGTDSTLVPPSSVDFTTQDGSAVANIDYVGVTNTIVFPRGETFETVVIPIIDNTFVDGDRFLNLLLANPTNGLALGPQPFATLLIVNDDSGVSFDAAQYRVAENTAAGAVIIPVIRSGSTVGTMSVDVATVGGSALPFVNYVPTTNTIVFNDGESNKTFRVQILNDGLVSGDQTVGLQLSNPQGGYLVSPNVATLTIAESSFGPGVLSFTQTNYSADESSGFATVTVQRTNGSTGPVSVTLSTSDGTAIAGADYAATSYVVSFADGEITKNVSIRLIDHTNVQPDKVFTVNLSNPQGGATIGVNNSAAVTILDDHMNFSFSSPAYFVRQDANQVVVTVLRKSGTNGTVSVNYSTTNAAPTNGVALPGEDYTTTSGTLTFLPGQTSQNIFIPILDDGQVSSDKQFNVLLSNPSPGTYLGLPDVATVSIQNVHSGLSFSNANFVVSEGVTNAVITVNRSAINTGTVTVHFTTSDGSPQSSSRYTPTNGVLTFLNGQATQTFTVPINDDNLVDGDATVNLTLFNPSPGATIVNSNAMLTILDNDIGLKFSSANYSVPKHGVKTTITVQRTSVTNLPVSVDFTTKDGSAVAPVNYITTNGTLTFLPGELAKTFDVYIQANNIITNDQTFSVDLLNPSTGGVLVFPSSARVTIVEDNGSLIIPAGKALVSESGPVNGFVDAGETVSFFFAFRNIGGGDTTNLVATLLNTNGIINASAAVPYNGVANSASYGPMIENGPSVSRQFTFKANATNNQVISATFVLEDVSGGVRHALGTNTFNFTIGSQTFSFTNASTIVINDSTNPPTKATPYPSQITVSGVPGNVAKVTATFVGLGHSYPDDIDALLVAPANQPGQSGQPLNTLLMAAVGGPFGFNNVRLTFDDAYPPLPNEQPITTGTNHPTLGTAASEPYFYPTFPAGAPTGPYPVAMSTFNGINPNGTWSLYVVDSTSFDSGIMSGGWILNVTTGAPVDMNADLGISITGSPTPATVSNVVNYHIDFTNYGPAGATNLVFTDVLPTGMTYLSNTCGCTFDISSNTLSCPLAYLLKDHSQSFDIYVRADVVGVFTNTISVKSDQVDLNTDNNTNSVVTEVDTPAADMAATITVSPNPILINNNVTITMTAINNGFSPAIGVMLTNQLPAGLSLQSVSSSLGSAVITTNASGLVVVSLGDMAVSTNPNTSPTVTIVATATNAGTPTITARVASSTFDPLKGNNTASAKLEVDPPTLGASAAQNGLLLSWPASAGNFVVEQATSLAPPAVWTPVSGNQAVLVNGQYQVQVSSSNSARFFRLRVQ